MAALSTVRDVELAKVGTWHASTGPWQCTREQLADAVRAQDDPAFRPAILKVGHVDPRFNAGEDADYDGEPAVGRVTNLRLSADGTTLIGDYEQVPTWLAEILTAAYPSRSVEMLVGVRTHAGVEYSAVLTGVALLGVQAPAIESLEDVAHLYEQPTAVDAWVAASRLAATAHEEQPVWPAVPDLRAPMTTAAAVPVTAPVTAAPMTAVSMSETSQPAAPLPVTSSAGGPMPTPTTTTPDATAPPPAATPMATPMATATQSTARAASGRVAAAASIEELRRAFYDWSEHDDAGLGDWAWICEVWTDSLIVDDEDGRLWRVSWTEADGTFTFDTPQKVRRTYVPVADTMVAAAAHRMSVPLRYFRGRGDVSASTPEETPAVADTATLAQLREKLGLGEETDEATVLAAALEKLSGVKPGDPTPPAEPTAPQATTDTTATTAPAAPSTAPAAPATPATEATAAPVPVAASTDATARELEFLRTQLQSVTTELAARRETERTATRDGILAAAMRDGKFAPAELERWQTDYDAAPDVVTRVLASIAPGARVPVRAAGQVGATPTGPVDEAEEILASVYGSARKGV